MKNAIVPLDSWPPLLPLYIAEMEASIGSPLYTLEEVCLHFGISPTLVDKYREQPKFRAEVRAAIQEIKDTNSVLRKKSKFQLENYIDTLVPKFLRDEEFPAAEKVKLLAFLAKISKVIDDPAEKVKAEAELAQKQPQQQQPMINIVLTHAEPPQISISKTHEKVINE